MMYRLAWRSLMTRPIRAAVLAAGFGFGIAVMAELLGVGHVILEQAHSPALNGGGDLVVRGPFGSVPSARFVMSSVLGASDLADHVAAASPSKQSRVFLMTSNGPVAVWATGGIPSLERSLGDLEVAGIKSWTDTPGDERWSKPDSGDVLRAMDRFHAIPDVPARASSWAEWLYFNGRTRDGRVRVYLTFLVGPRADTPGKRHATVRFQLERDGRFRNYSAHAEVDETVVLANAPDLEIAGNRVRLDGRTYRMTLALDVDRESSVTQLLRPAPESSEKEESTISAVGEGPQAVSRAGLKTRRYQAGEAAVGDGLPPSLKLRRTAVALAEAGQAVPTAHLSGEIVLEAAPNQSLPPSAIRGADGWVSGYVVPVLRGAMRGTVRIGEELLSFADAAGYHDHNWGFWEGVSWQWGQVAHGDLSVVYGRIFPPPDVADPARVPGYLAVLGPDGPLAFAAGVTIDDSQAGRVNVSAKSRNVDLQMAFAADETVRTAMDLISGPGVKPLTFVQMGGAFRVSGTAAARSLDFEARGSAETFKPR
jgi:hypothetical protein